MKYLKRFEMNENKIDVDDYVILNDDIDYQSLDGNNLRDYLNSHIGKIYRIRTRSRNDKIIPIYDIEYKNAPDDIRKFLSFTINDDFSESYLERSRDAYEIKYWSKNKEELELILKSNKFNI